MSANPSSEGREFRAYQNAREHSDILRFITCGSVDDGKSTLIGRLLYESRLVFQDQLAQVEADSKRHGTQGDNLDLALLVDGLQAEREQGITIDVAYRMFSTSKRSFIVADTPGHEQYTRNMVTGASTADLAVVLIDARKGVLPQTCRHTTILSLLGVRHVILAINKMDLVDWSKDVHDRIVEAYSHFAQRLDVTGVTCIPVSALTGDNVTEPSTAMDWYDGPTLLQALESADVATDRESAPFRMPVQWVNRPNAEFRGFAGTIASGLVRPGDPVLVCPSNRPSTVDRIVGPDGDLDCARAGQAVTLTLADEIDVSRGDIIASATDPPSLSDQFACHVVWMNEKPLLPERPYLLKIGTRLAEVQVTRIKYKLNVTNLEHTAAKTLELNDIAYCNIGLDRQIAFDPYRELRETGSFILIDRYSHDTVGAGMIDFGLWRGSNLTLHQLAIDKAGARGPEEPEGLRPVAHRFVGRGQIRDSQCRGAAPARHGPAQLYPGRRQSAARLDQGPGLHRGGPGGERAPHRRSRQAVRRRGADRSRLRDFALPRRAQHGSRDDGGRRVHRGLRRCPHRGLRAARSQGPLPEGPGRPDQELHRRRQRLRTARAPGDRVEDRGAERRRDRGPGHRLSSLEGGGYVTRHPHLLYPL